VIDFGRVGILTSDSLTQFVRQQKLLTDSRIYLTRKLQTQTTIASFPDPLSFAQALHRSGLARKGRTALSPLYGPFQQDIQLVAALAHARFVGPATDIALNA
jgi:hypothetical protein